MDKDIDLLMPYNIIIIPPKGTPEIFVKYRENPDEKGKEQVYRLTADEVFGR